MPTETLSFCVGKLNSLQASAAQEPVKVRYRNNSNTAIHFDRITDLKAPLAHIHTILWADVCSGEVVTRPVDSILLMLHCADDGNHIGRIVFTRRRAAGLLAKVRQHGFESFGCWQVFRATLKSSRRRPCIR